MLSDNMCGRLRIVFAVVICLVVLGTFLVHKPACSESRMLHNKPVPAFRALSANTYAKAAVSAVVQIAVVHYAVSDAPQFEPVAPEFAPAFQAAGAHSLSCCLLC